MVAAGQGLRMGSAAPKQYHALGGKAVIDWSAEQLLSLKGLSGLMLVVADGDTVWQQRPWANHPKLMTAVGGAQRSDSVLAGLLALRRVGAQVQDRVLVHDAARPAVSMTDIQRLIDAVGEDINGGLLAVPVRDTLKRMNAAGAVAETVNRDGLWQALTPQLFPLGALTTALEATPQTPATDEAQAMERMGYHPRLVEGSAENIKYTYPGDAALLEAVLSQHRSRSA